MKTRLTYFICLFLLLLVTGVFWGTWFPLTRSLNSFSANEFIHIGKVIISNIAVPMRIIFPSCILFMVLSLWFYDQKKSAGFTLAIVSFVLLIITLVITLSILVPIDNHVKVWTVSTIPANWEEIRDKWQFYHAFRTFTSLASFAFFTIAILSGSIRESTP